MYFNVAFVLQCCSKIISHWKLPIPWFCSHFAINILLPLSSLIAQWREQQYIFQHFFQYFPLLRVDYFTSPSTRFLTLLCWYFCFYCFFNFDAGSYCAHIHTYTYVAANWDIVFITGRIRCGNCENFFVLVISFLT